MLLFVYFSFESTQSHEQISFFFFFFSKAAIIVNMLIYGMENFYWQTEGHFACVIQIYVQICLDQDVDQNMSRTFFIHHPCYICIVNLKVVCFCKSVLGTNLDIVSIIDFYLFSLFNWTNELHSSVAVQEHYCWGRINRRWSRTDCKRLE